MAAPPTKPQTLARWRVVLGKGAEAERLADLSGDPELAQAAELLDFLFEEKGGESGTGSREGGRGASGGLTVARWVDEVRELFPRTAKEVLERELVKRRGIAELLEKPELLERIEPNVDLVKTLITHRELLNEKT